MNIGSLVTAPNGVHINAKTIIECIHGFCTWVCYSPQRCKKFAIAVDFCQPELDKKGIKCLEFDVSTQWNFTFLMFQGAILLQKTCTNFCKHSSKTSGFLLLPEEWNQAKNIMKLLEPLSKATELLCASKYPILNTALPIYIVLIQHLQLVCHGLL